MPKKNVGSPGGHPQNKAQRAKTKADETLTERLGSKEGGAAMDVVHDDAARAMDDLRRHVDRDPA